MRFASFEAIRRRNTFSVMTAALVVGMISSQAAFATSFSWGDINPGDDIGKIVMGSGATTSYDSGTELLTISGDVSTINFGNKAAISGITGVSFSAVLSLTATDVVALPFPPFTVLAVSASFSGVGFTIHDSTAGIDLLTGGWGAGGLTLDIADQLGFLKGALVADITGLGSQDADFLSAFSTNGAFDQDINIGAAGDWCVAVLDCPGNTLKSFNTTGIGNVTHTPEPTTFTLVTLGLAGLAAARRVRRR